MKLKVKEIMDDLVKGPNPMTIKNRQQLEYI